MLGAATTFRRGSSSSLRSEGSPVKPVYIQLEPRLLRSTNLKTFRLSFFGVYFLSPLAPQPPAEHFFCCLLSCLACSWRRTASRYCFRLPSLDRYYRRLILLYFRSWARFRYTLLENRQYLTSGLGLPGLHPPLHSCDPCRQKPERGHHSRRSLRRQIYQPTQPCVSEGGRPSDGDADRALPRMRQMAKRSGQAKIKVLSVLCVPITWCQF